MIRSLSTDQSPSNSPTASSNSADAATSDATDTPPEIQVNGSNPAIIQVGATYNDLGASITGPKADLNLGIHTFVNGVKTEPVQLATSAAATGTIQYVVTDQSGLTSTSTRTVIIEPAPQPASPTTSADQPATASTATTPNSTTTPNTATSSANDASSTDSTSTAQ